MSGEKHTGRHLGTRRDRPHSSTGWNPSRDAEAPKDDSRAQPDRGTRGVVRARGTGRKG